MTDLLLNMKLTGDFSQEREIPISPVATDAIINCLVFHPLIL
jgi:hypothetical protein